MCDMRSEFEKLPVVDKILKDKRLRWNNKTKCYTGLDGKYCDDTNPVSLAWYTFQEQQRKIDAITDLCNNKRGDIHWQVDSFIEEVEELLK